MDKPEFKAVIFDLDGILSDTARLHYRAWKQLADSLAIPFDEALNEELKGVDRMRALDLILLRGNRSCSQEQKLALAHTKNLRYRQLIEFMSPADLLPGAMATLNAVRRADLMIGLASASENTLTVLDRLGITDWFDHIVDANAIKNGKPDPEIFLVAADNLAVEPAACLGVEGSMAGIRSVKAAGMFALGVGNPAVLQEAHRVIPGLDHFRLPDFLLTEPA